MKKSFLIVAVLYGFALLQTSFFVHFFPHGFIVNLVIATVIIFSIFEKPESWSSFTAALFGGFLLDVFSGGYIGVWPAMLFGLALVIKMVLENYVRISFAQRF